MKNKIVIVALIIFIFFLAFYGLTYHQWQNKKTVVKTGSFNKEFTKITLNRDEVAPYFEQLQNVTKQDALINIKELPSENFNFIREFRNAILVYFDAVIFNKEILLSESRNIDYYFIDQFGLAAYKEFYDINDDSWCGVFDRPLMNYTEENMYNSILKQGFTPDTTLRLPFITQEWFLTTWFSYPIIVSQEEDTIYININYLHSNEIFNGKYKPLSVPRIMVADKEMVIEKDKALIIKKREEGKSSNYYIGLSRNELIATYNLLNINGLQYIDIYAVNKLYGYKVTNIFSVLSGYTGSYDNDYADSIDFGINYYPLSHLLFYTTIPKLWYEKMYMLERYREANITIIDPARSEVAK